MNGKLMVIDNKKEWSKASSQTQPRGIFDLLYFPLGPSIIFVAVIGSPKSCFKMIEYASRIKYLVKTLYIKTLSQDKLGVGPKSRGILIPLLYTGIESIITTVRGVDDNRNSLAAGTLTGIFYKGGTGNIKSLIYGGLMGFGLSSIYCSWKNEELTTRFIEKTQKRNDNNDLQEQNIYFP